MERSGPGRPGFASGRTLVTTKHKEILLNGAQAPWSGGQNLKNLSANLEKTRGANCFAPLSLDTFRHLPAQSSIKLTLNPGTIPPRWLFVEVRCGLCGWGALWLAGDHGGGVRLVRSCHEEPMGPSRLQRGAVEGEVRLVRSCHGEPMGPSWLQRGAVEGG